MRVIETMIEMLIKRFGFQVLGSIGDKNLNKSVAIISQS